MGAIGGYNWQPESRSRPGCPTAASPSPSTSPESFSHLQAWLSSSPRFIQVHFLLCSSSSSPLTNHYKLSPTLQRTCPGPLQHRWAPQISLVSACSDRDRFKWHGCSEQGAKRAFGPECPDLSSKHTWRCVLPAGRPSESAPVERDPSLLPPHSCAASRTLRSSWDQTRRPRAPSSVQAETGRTGS
jgi:hypothetical protein